MKVLVLNAGSSSLKLTLADVSDGPSASVGNVLWSEDCSMSLADESEDGIVETIREKLQKNPTSEEIVAVGHRVVHGGTKLTRAMMLDDTVITEIETLCQIAPLHNPIALKVIKASRQLLQSAAHYAVFDTAFHSNMPLRSKVYPLPYEWFSDKNLMRFGFHGTSHKYCSSRGAALTGKTSADVLMVTCHLGNGCSLAAVSHGTSIDTTMGFTPLEGLMMGSRSGSIDPGVLLHMARTGISIDDIDNILNKHSGLAGVSGISKDMREIVAARQSGHERATLAFDIFVHRLAGGVGAMTAALGGLDILAFTGGIGENSSEVRQETCARLAFLGVKLDLALNSQPPADRVISTSESQIAVVVVQAREDLAILEEWIDLSGKR